MCHHNFFHSFRGKHSKLDSLEGEGTSPVHFCDLVASLTLILHTRMNNSNLFGYILEIQNCPLNSSSVEGVMLEIYNILFSRAIFFRLT